MDISKELRDILRTPHRYRRNWKYQVFIARRLPHNDIDYFDCRLYLG